MTRTLTCTSTPKRINPRPSITVSLENINGYKNRWLPHVIMSHLTTEKETPEGIKKRTKGVVRIYGLELNPDALIIEVRMTNGLYKTAGRVHHLLQELLGEELELDRRALRPNVGRAHLSRVSAQIHPKSADTQ